MRLPVETSTGRLRRPGLTLVLATALAGCGGSGVYTGLEAGPAASSQLQANGPASDYPVVVGEPYRIGNTLFTPVDTLNYDEVGYAAADTGRGISAASHTLPLPSYAEVTSLATGRTILVRVERRGPMTSDALIALSPAAVAQLGGGAGDPVRVRRVNPPEEERTILRAGQSAPLRMDTPESLVTVLKRKLPEGGAPAAVQPVPQRTVASIDVPPSAATATPPRAPVSAPVAAGPVAQSTARPTPLPQPPLPSRAELGREAVPPPAARPPQAQPARTVVVAEDGRYVVQAAALSSYDRARRVASAIGGTVSQSGSMYRIRTGPFATRVQAEASLAKVQAAGYSDARIFTNG